MLALILLLGIGALMQVANTFATPGSSVLSAELVFGYLLLTAYLTGNLFQRLSMPRLTGYIVAGVIAGPSPTTPRESARASTLGRFRGASGRHEVRA